MFLCIMKNLTAIIKKGERQFVSICPEVDVVSQGYTFEESLNNLKEAVELYIEEMGVPEEISSENTIITSFEVNQNAKTPQIIG
jgi:predicted RNase H-like HicB family nuclease